MLYDCQRNGPAVIPTDLVTSEDLVAFCEYVDARFHAVGDPENWARKDVFRVATNDWPSRGKTYSFEIVAQWKAAMSQIGGIVKEGGRYMDQDGNKVVTVCETADARSGQPLIVYRGADGKSYNMPTDEFFGVVNRPGGSLAPRYTLIP